MQSSLAHQPIYAAQMLEVQEVLGVLRSIHQICAFLSFGDWVCSTALRATPDSRLCLLRKTTIQRQRVERSIQAVAHVVEQVHASGAATGIVVAVATGIMARCGGDFV